MHGRPLKDIICDLLYHQVQLFYRQPPAATRKLMAHNQVFYLREPTVVYVQVGTANGRAGYPDNCITGIFQPGVLCIIVPDIFWFVKYCCFHCGLVI